MSSYEQDKINLKEAMTTALSKRIRVWNIPGLHVKVDNLPEKATVQKTFVMMTSNGNWLAGISCTIEGETGECIVIVLNCSSLQELLDKIPELFEVDGSLDDLG